MNKINSFPTSSDEKNGKKWPMDVSWCSMRPDDFSLKLNLIWVNNPQVWHKSCHHSKQGQIPSASFTFVGVCASMQDPIATASATPKLPGRMILGCLHQWYSNSVQLYLRRFTPQVSLCRRGTRLAT